MITASCRRVLPPRRVEPSRPSRRDRREARRRRRRRRCWRVPRWRSRARRGPRRRSFAGARGSRATTERSPANSAAFDRTSASRIAQKREQRRLGDRRLQLLERAECLLAHVGVRVAECRQRSPRRARRRAGSAIDSIAAWRTSADGSRTSGASAAPAERSPNCPSACAALCRSSASGSARRRTMPAVGTPDSYSVSASSACLRTSASGSASSAESPFTARGSLNSRERLRRGGAHLGFAIGERGDQRRHGARILQLAERLGRGGADVGVLVLESADQREHHRAVGDRGARLVGASDARFASLVGRNRDV